MSATTQPLHVHLLPSLVAPEELAGAMVVVIDVLRASTTIAHALAAGAKEMIPCLEVDEARAVAKKLPRGPCVLAGERGGLAIEGFDLGNSPQDFTPETVGGKTVIFTTTNGTAALKRARPAGRVLLGSFVVLNALAAEIAAQALSTHLLCAGTNGAVTLEDALLAGALVEKLPQKTGGWRLNDEARIAQAAWREFERSARPLADYLTTETQGGRNLQALGLAADIAFAARQSVFDFLPELDVTQWRVTRR
ncbi:MAG: 2-phosphosulfolactate phosphatase [Planctomycetia bacterium]|nr:2-phosphosulfolactate phosphatase [Planctomycetia bacterium]